MGDEGCGGGIGVVMRVAWTGGNGMNNSRVEKMIARSLLVRTSIRRDDISA